jgi:hypothetical protein
LNFEYWNLFGIWYLIFGTFFNTGGNEVQQPRVESLARHHAGHGRLEAGSSLSMEFFHKMQNQKSKASLAKPAKDAKESFKAGFLT